MKTNSSSHKPGNNSLRVIFQFLRRPVLHVFSVLLGFVTSSHAGTHVWSGAGANTNWSNPANWSSGGVPTSVEAAPVKLVFPSNATSFTSTLNIANLKIDVIEFNLNSSNNYVFPNGGTSTTFTGAAGDNLRIIGVSGNVIWQPAVHLQATTRINVEGNQGANIDFQGIVSGPGGITKQGLGNLLFSTGASANTFSGTLRLEAGNLRLAKVAGTPCFGGNLHIMSGNCTIGVSHQIPDSASILMEGGSLSTTPIPGVASVTETLGPVTMSGVASIRATSPNTINLGSSVTRDGTLGNTHLQSDAPSGQISLGSATRTFNVINGRLRLYGNITNGSGTGGITKTGAGELEIRDACSYTGSVSVQEGVLSIRNNQSLGTTAGGTTVMANGTLQLGISQSGSVILPASEALSVSGTVIAYANAEIPGPVSLSGSPVLGADFGVLLTLSGIVSGSVTELKFGRTAGVGGTVRLNGTAGNTYSGLASINTGAILELGKSAGQAITGTLRFNLGTAKLLAPQQIADTGSIFFPDSANGTFDLNGFNETLGFAFGPGLARIFLGDGTLTVNGTSSVQLGSLANPANIAGSALARIRKLGSGTWTLFATPATDGNQAILSVEAGGMDFQGQWPGEIQCIGGTLKGSGIVGPIKGLGGTVSPSNITSAGFSGQASGTVSVKIDGDSAGLSFDRMMTSGPVNLTGQTLQLTSSGFIPATSTGYRIFVNNSSDPIQGTFAGLPEGATVMMNGLPFTISYKGGDGNDVVLYFQGQGTPGPQITQVVPRPDGFVEIHLKFRPNANLGLERSTDLNPPWTYLGSYLLNVQGEGVVTRNEFGRPRCFYRLQFFTF